jgi:putative SOS response-associated peptidase YedK
VDLTGEGISPQPTGCGKVQRVCLRRCEINSVSHCGIFQTSWELQRTSFEAKAGFAASQAMRLNDFHDRMMMLFTSRSLMCGFADQS